mgnify:CR=1 FL=1
MSTLRTIRCLVGLMAGCILAACGAKRTSDADIKAIHSNLRQYHAAATMVFLETGKDKVTYADVVGSDKYIRSIAPVNGENYTDLVVKPDSRSLSVTTADGRQVVWLIPQ